MNPLCITIRPPLEEEIGIQNIQNFIQRGYEHLMITPNREIDRLIDKDNFINEEVEAISMSEYLLSNFDKSNYIVCKLDVEGAEFKIIQDLIKQNCLKYLNEAYVEWHPQYNSNYSSKDVSNLKKIMIRNGMYVGFWL